jgi:hypothetical protein
MAHNPSSDCECSICALRAATVIFSGVYPILVNRDRQARLKAAVRGVFKHDRTGLYELRKLVSRYVFRVLTRRCPSCLEEETWAPFETEPSTESSNFALHANLAVAVSAAEVMASAHVERCGTCTVLGAILKRTQTPGIESPKERGARIYISYSKPFPARSNSVEVFKLRKIDDLNPDRQATKSLPLVTPDNSPCIQYEDLNNPYRDVWDSIAKWRLCVEGMHGIPPLLAVHLI